MARVNVPAVALGLLAVGAAALCAGLTFLLAGRALVGAMWAICVFLGLLVATVAVVVLRSARRGRNAEP